MGFWRGEYVSVWTQSAILSYKLQFSITEYFRTFKWLNLISICLNEIWRSVPLNIWVILNKFLNHSKYWFSHLQNENNGNNLTYLIGLFQVLFEIIHVKLLAQNLVHSKYSINAVYWVEYSKTNHIVFSENLFKERLINRC